MSMQSPYRQRALTAIAPARQALWVTLVLIATPAFANERELIELRVQLEALQQRLDASTPADIHSLNYALTRFEGGAADGVDRETERALFSRIQVSY